MLSKKPTLAPHVYSTEGSSAINLHTHLPFCTHVSHQLKSQHFSLAAKSYANNNQDFLNLCKASSAGLTASEV